MTSRAVLTGTVEGRRVLSTHLVRLEIACPGFVTTGVPDEWVALTVPGQYQTRYYTVVSAAGDHIVLDVVLHSEGLVTEWARTRCVGETVGIGAPKGSFTPAVDAAWVVLVGDLTALPAVGRIASSTGLPLTAYVEAAGGPVPAYSGLPATWLQQATPTESGLAALVRGLTWPDEPGYFWMAGESAQMRDIRRHLRHDLHWDSSRYDVMGYWSGSRGRARRSVDPGPIYRRGKAAGLSDEQIWDEYDAAREER
ncbi:MAG: siderophore-interacting protein [Actinomycetota bacterium]|nr:siderophore-interacting protein [Actinomycetota bacterium]MDQ6934009.1 siderophore-interacting protein [Actinomycetota bacterium]